ncbi:MAG TPA: DUF1376 domain-containing protein [Nitrobacter sp.]|nr:DUF1376 domain-containing protein [Nitrobacter sp.]
MSARHYHKRYHSDALAGFMSLTLEERGAYQTLLDMMYDRGGPLLDNDRLLAGYMQVSIRKWRSLRAELIAKGKIFITPDGQLFNSRVKKELENVAKTSRKLSESGAKGGRTRAENEKKDSENNDGSQASLKEGSSEAQAIPDTRYQKKSSDPKGSAAKPLADPAKALFDLGVSLLMAASYSEERARSLVGKWRKQVGDERLRLILMAAFDKTDPIAWVERSVENGEAETNEYWTELRRKYASG